MKLSIIIPVGKEETNFHLIQQIRNQFVDSEIILVCDSKFDRKNLASISYHQLLFIDNSTRAKALNEGSRCAKYSYLWFLHLDSNITNITPKDVERLEDNQLYYFSLAFENSLNTQNPTGALSDDQRPRRRGREAARGAACGQHLGGRRGLILPGRTRIQTKALGHCRS